MAGEVKAGLTLPWIWVAFIIAYLSVGFMLPPFDKPLKQLGKTKVQMQEQDNSKGNNDIVF